VATALTLNADPAAEDAGDVVTTLATFTSACELTAVVAFVLVIALLPGVESFTCNWSMATEAFTEKLWFEEPVQVTDQAALIGVAVDWARELF
jgi:hypothetical protein